MLTLYNAPTSVCSVKVRIGLAEKQLEWRDILFNLAKGEQFAPDYLKLNPIGVVPTLIDKDLVVTESSLILEYIDALSTTQPLMPTDPSHKVAAKLWLLRCLDIHAAINSLTFSTAKRDQIRAKKTPEEIEHSISKMPSPKMAAKRRDLMEFGIHSKHVQSDFFTLKRTFEDMQKILETHNWISGTNFGIADIALIAYIDRLEHLSMSGLWQTHFPKIEAWLSAMKARPSYQSAFLKYVTPEELNQSRETGAPYWQELEKLWLKSLEN